MVGIEQKIPTRLGRYTPYIHLDNAASTPALQPVMEQMGEWLNWYSGVHRGTGHKSMLSSRRYDDSHTIIGQFVGADLDRNSVILVKNTTEAINKLASRFPWEPGDIVLSTEMEHHSNDLPWRPHARVEYVGVKENGLLDMQQLQSRLKELYPRVRLVAVCGASNVTGHINDIHAIAAWAHEYGARILVDGAQLVPHAPLDMKPDHHPGHLDFLAFSGHKMYAPFGCGVLIGPQDFFYQGDPDFSGGGTVSLVTPEEVIWAPLPDREEAGSPNVIGAYALAATLKYLQTLGMDRLALYEEELTRYALDVLLPIPGLTVYGALPRVGVISFNMDGFSHAQLGSILCQEAGIGVRTGCFCAQSYVRQLLGVELDRRALPLYLSRSDLMPGMVRISLAAYNTRNEIDVLAKLLKKLADRPQYYQRLYPFHTWERNYIAPQGRLAHWLQVLSDG